MSVSASIPIAAGFIEEFSNFVTGCLSILAVSSCHNYVLPHWPYFSVSKFLRIELLISNLKSIIFKSGLYITKVK